MRELISKIIPRFILFIILAVLAYLFLPNTNSSFDNNNTLLIRLIVAIFIQVICCIVLLNIFVNILMTYKIYNLTKNKHTENNKHSTHNEKVFGNRTWKYNPETNEYESDFYREIKEEMKKTKKALYQKELSILKINDDFDIITESFIKQKWKEIAKTLHPDKHHHNKEFYEEQFKIASQAYETLIKAKQKGYNNG